MARKVPEYGREKVDEIMGIIRRLAEESEEDESVIRVRIELPVKDLLVLNDMLKEMDRHLPDFFDG